VTLSLIWAQSLAAPGRPPLIGRSGGIPWHVPEDFTRFKALTLGHPVLMGRATWESLPRRPLPRRRNIVLSRGSGPFDGAEHATSLKTTLAALDDVWVIGGSGVYSTCLPLADRLEVTEVDVDLGAPRAGDVAAPELPAEGWRRTTGDWQQSRTGLRYRFSSFTR